MINKNSIVTSHQETPENDQLLEEYYATITTI